MAKVWKNGLKNWWNICENIVEKNSGKTQKEKFLVDKTSFTQNYPTIFRMVLNRFLTPNRIVSFPLFTHSLILQLLNI